MPTTRSTGFPTTTSNRSTPGLSEGVKLGLTLLGLIGSGAITIVLFVRSRKQRQAPATSHAPAEQRLPLPALPEPITPKPIAAKPIAAVYPLPMLADDRKPRITSHHKTRNPSRPTHDGVDFFYPVLPGDPAWKRGDGEGTANGKWIVPRGTPAIAVNAGRVQLAGNTPTGWRVWIDHGPVRSGYFHLTKIFVSEGEQVTTGQQLGIVGDNPRDHDARHLHFEVSAADKYAPVDPVPFLQGAVFLPLAETTGPIRTIEAMPHIA